MSYHKARPDAKRPDPNQPASTVMASGRVAKPHAEVDGKPIMGGLQNAVVEGVGRTADEEKSQVQSYHKNREEVKKAHAEYFDPKTGDPKAAVVEFAADPVGDANAAPVDGPVASPEEVKKNADAEKKSAEKK